MSGGLTYNDPEVREVWDAYVAEAQPAHEAYAAMLEAAQRLRDEAEEQTRQRSRTDRHTAWEAHTETVTTAWREYLGSTRDARARRDVALQEIATRRGVPYSSPPDSGDPLNDAVTAAGLIQ